MTLSPEQQANFEAVCDRIGHHNAYLLDVFVAGMNSRPLDLEEAVLREANAQVFVARAQALMRDAEKLVAENYEPTWLDRLFFRRKK